MALSEGTRPVSMVVLGMIVAPAFVPILLPWLPGRAFSAKGLTVGVVTLAILFLVDALPVASLGDKLDTAGWALMVPAAVSFVGMNFTGASTFTSLSGVKKEMRYSVPIQIAAAVTGLLLWAGAKFHAGT
jgi:acetyl-CoA decarbonylase/synthase complex subunit gamma